MKRTVIEIVVGLLIGVGAVGAHEGHHDEAAERANQEQTLTGEVVDVVCYLSHDQQGLGKGHADCGKKCIKSGLPVAIKVGDQLYLASMSDHTPANRSLADYAGTQVTVHGMVLEKDGQHLVAISRIDKAP